MSPLHVVDDDVEVPSERPCSGAAWSMGSCEAQRERRAHRRIYGMHPGHHREKRVSLCLSGGNFRFLRADDEVYIIDLRFVEDYPARPGTSVLHSIEFSHYYKNLPHDLEAVLSERYGLSFTNTEGRRPTRLGLGTVKFKLTEIPPYPKYDKKGRRTGEYHEGTRLYNITLESDPAVVARLKAASESAVQQARQKEQHAPF